MSENRWCIIAGTRSGSTWLEEMMWNASKNNPGNIKLGEFILPRIAGNFDLNYSLDSDNNIIETNIPESFDSVKDFFIKRCNILYNSNTKQSVAFRVFPQTWEYPEFSYLDFFKKLEDRKFKIISLNRNLFDRATSGYFMEHTKKIHRRIDWQTEPKQFYSTMDNAFVNVEPLQKTYIDIADWSRIFLMCFYEDNDRRALTDQLNCPVINYNRALLDCIKYKIPVYPKTSLLKTYEEEYESIIENYEELKEAYFEIIQSLEIIDDKFK